jgi:hypothetical protein
MIGVLTRGSMASRHQTGATLQRDATLADALAVNLL